MAWFGYRTFVWLSASVAAPLVASHIDLTKAISANQDRIVSDLQAQTKLMGQQTTMIAKMHATLIHHGTILDILVKSCPLLEVQRRQQQAKDGGQ